jgi:hypothetical protein
MATTTRLRRSTRAALRAAVCLIFGWIGRSAKSSPGEKHMQPFFSSFLLLEFLILVYKIDVLPTQGAENVR